MVQKLWSALRRTWRWQLNPPPEISTREYDIPAEHQELWQRIEAFPIDKPGVPKPLSLRLAQEQAWHPELALQMIGEYKKFMFLCMVSPHMVVPSKSVDEVWHLHLIYTASYWVAFCGKTLGRQIHHHPGDGSDEDTEKFRMLYERTLDLYCQYFGEPPFHIWGPRENAPDPEQQYWDSLSDRERLNLEIAIASTRVFPFA